MTSLMRKFVRRAPRFLAIVVLILPAALSAIPSQATTTTIMVLSNIDETKTENPLVSKWQGPYGGVPPFDLVQVALFKPALEAAMAAQLAEVERIAKNSAAPDFENTIVALEEAGQELNRVSTLYGVWGSTMNGPEFQVVQREMAPRLAAFNDRITQNELLFKRIEAVYNSPAKSKLNPEQQRLAWLYYTNFVRAGARLTPEAKARLSEINQRLARLYTKFSQNVLAEETDQFIVLKSEEE